MASGVDPGWVWGGGGVKCEGKCVSSPTLIKEDINICRRVTKAISHFLRLQYIHCNQLLGIPMSPVRVEMKTPHFDIPSHNSVVGAFEPTSFSGSL